MTLQKNILIATMTIGLAYTNNVLANDVNTTSNAISKIYCDFQCDNILKAVTDTINAQDYKHADNMLFEQYDNHVLVNSMTYREYVDAITSQVIVESLVKTKAHKNAPPLNIIQDGALSCVYDRQYDCEAWNDPQGTNKAYIMHLQNLMKTSSWTYTLRQSDIDQNNRIMHTRYNAAINALTLVPVARLASIIAKSLKITPAQVMEIAAIDWMVDMIKGEIFRGAPKTKLKVGDVITIKNGKIVKITRNGASYTPRQLTGAGYGGSGGSSGDGNGSSAGGGGTDLGNLPVIHYCYRDFSNGQTIRVPCP